MALERIIYRSLATDIFTQGSGLDCIFRSARNKNCSAGLNGALYFCDEHFVQVLEGSADAVDLLMEKLYNDMRHHCIEILGRWKIHDRLFSQWSMAHAAPSSDLLELKKRFESDGSGVELVNLLYNAASRSARPL